VPRRTLVPATIDAAAFRPFGQVIDRNDARAARSINDGTAWRVHDLARTEVLFAANIRGFTNVPIVDYLGERLACPVALENDANAAGLAEAILGAARYASSTMFINPAKLV